MQKQRIRGVDRGSRVAIIGGGPGGLTLARLLHTKGLSSTVFELDEHELARPQGGSLDLHRDTAILAMQRAGLGADFERIARYEDQGMRLYDVDAKLLFDDEDMHAGPDRDEERPEVDRTQLRSVLLASLPEGAVRWGMRVRSIEPLDDGTYQVIADRGSFGPFDLVVGADGTWSRVRPLVSEEKPIYTGVTFLELEHDDVDRTNPELAAFVGRGKMFALGSSKTICSQRSSNAHYRTYVAFRQPEAWFASTFDYADVAGTKKKLHGLLSEFAKPIHDLIDRSSDSVVARPLYALPVGHRWKHRKGVTLLGDAAHVMSPFSGEGVNIAMFDALQLAEAIAAHGIDHGALVFEEEMFVRAAPVAAGAAEGIATAICPDAQTKVLAWMSMMSADAQAQANGSIASAPNNTTR